MSFSMLFLLISVEKKKKKKTLRAQNPKFPPKKNTRNASFFAHFPIFPALFFFHFQPKTSFFTLLHSFSPQKNAEKRIKNPQNAQKNTPKKAEKAPKKLKKKLKKVEKKLKKLQKKLNKVGKMGENAPISERILSFFPENATKSGDFDARIAEFAADPAARAAWAGVRE
jgi:hypothetical protein